MRGGCGGFRRGRGRYGIHANPMGRGEGTSGAPSFLPPAPSGSPTLLSPSSQLPPPGGRLGAGDAWHISGRRRHWSSTGFFHARYIPGRQWASSSQHRWRWPRHSSATGSCAALPSSSRCDGHAVRWRRHSAGGSYGCIGGAACSTGAGMASRSPWNVGGLRSARVDHLSTRGTLGWKTCRGATVRTPTRGRVTGSHRSHFGSLSPPCSPSWDCLFRSDPLELLASARRELPAPLVGDRVSGLGLHPTVGRWGIAKRARLSGRGGGGARGRRWPGRGLPRWRARARRRCTRLRCCRGGGPSPRCFGPRRTPR